jgi:hypothetical protein
MHCGVWNTTPHRPSTRLRHGQGRRDADRRLCLLAESASGRRGARIGAVANHVSPSEIRFMSRLCLRRICQARPAWEDETGRARQEYWTGLLQVQGWPVRCKLRRRLRTSPLGPGPCNRARRFSLPKLVSTGARMGHGFGVLNYCRAGLAAPKPARARQFGRSRAHDHGTDRRSQLISATTPERSWSAVVVVDVRQGRGGQRWVPPASAAAAPRPR